MQVITESEKYNYPMACKYINISQDIFFKYQTTFLKYVLPRLALYVPPFLSIQNLDHIAQFDKVVWAGRNSTWGCFKKYLGLLCYVLGFPKSWTISTNIEWPQPIAQFDKVVSIGHKDQVHNVHRSIQVWNRTVEGNFRKGEASL